MRDFFSMDGTLFRFLSKVADIMILNLLFILCCLPVVTIGAAVTALSYVTLKMKDQEEGYIWKSFFQSFKQNFGQATVIWLIMLALGAVLRVDLWLTGAMHGNLQLLMRVCVGAGILVWLMVFLYVFPLQSRFYNTIGMTMKNALLLAIGNFPRTACMILVMIGAAVLTVWNNMTFWYGILVWLMFGFAAIAWINSQLLYGIFAKLMPEEAAAGDQAEQ